MNRTMHVSVLATCITCVTCLAQEPKPPGSLSARAPQQISGIAVTEILTRLGARLERAATDADLRGYRVQFDRADVNSDGNHSRSEYVNRGRYLTPQARAGIFRAADANQDGFVSRAEYTLNRIITDEAKEIIEAADSNRNGQIERTEFVSLFSRRMKERGLTEAVFAALDTNRDGRLLTPEYLRTWGRWARSAQPPAEQRITARRAVLAQAADSPEANATPRRRGPTGRQTPPHVDQVFRRFDANRDGALDIQEVPPFVQQFVFPADANRDDKVTREELEAFRAARPNRDPNTDRRDETDIPSPRRSVPPARDPAAPQRNARRRGPPTPEQFIQQALQFDQDGDGQLDRQELLNFARSLPRRRGRDRLRRFPGDGAGNRGARRQPPGERIRPNAPRDDDATP